MILSEVAGLSLRFQFIPESDDEGPARLGIYERGGERVFAEGDPLSLSDINGLVRAVYLAGVRDGAADGGNQDEARRRIEAALFPAGGSPA